MLNSVRQSLPWYAYLLVFAVVAVPMAVSSGAGVVFALILMALMTLMHIAWLALAQLCRLRAVAEANLEVQTALLEQAILERPNLNATVTFRGERP